MDLSKLSLVCLAVVVCIMLVLGWICFRNVAHPVGFITLPFLVTSAKTLLLPFPLLLFLLLFLPPSLTYPFKTFERQGDASCDELHYVQTKRLM